MGEKSSGDWSEMVTTSVREERLAILTVRVVKLPNGWRPNSR